MDSYGGYDNWITREMVLLLGNDEFLYRESREFAQKDASGEALRTWVSEWFWGDMKNFPEHSRSTIVNVRYDTDVEEFKDVDWRDVRDFLVDE